MNKQKAYRTYESTNSYYHKVDDCNFNKKGMRWEKRCTYEVNTLIIVGKYENYVFQPKQTVITSTGETIEAPERLARKKQYNSVWTTKKFPQYIMSEIEKFKLRDFSKEPKHD